MKRYWAGVVFGFFLAMAVSVPLWVSPSTPVAYAQNTRDGLTPATFRSGTFSATAFTSALSTTTRRGKWWEFAVMNDTDQILEVSFDAGTTVHLTCPAVGSVGMRVFDGFRTVHVRLVASPGVAELVIVNGS